MEQMAAEGMKLFEPETGPVEVDTAAAEKYKADIDAQITAIDEEIAKLTGKENKKERTAKSKEASDLKVGKQYIDACKVMKGLEPKNGFFVLAGQEAKKAPKKEEEPVAAAPAEVVEVKKEKKREGKEGGKCRYQPSRAERVGAAKEGHH